MTTVFKVAYILIYIGCVCLSAIWIENTVQHIKTSMYVYKVYLKKMDQKEKDLEEENLAQFEDVFIKSFSTGNTKMVFIEKSTNFAPKGFYDFAD